MPIEGFSSWLSAAALAALLGTMPAHAQTTQAQAQMRPEPPPSDAAEQRARAQTQVEQGEERSSEKERVKEQRQSGLNTSERPSEEPLPAEEARTAASDPRAQPANPPAQAAPTRAQPAKRRAVRRHHAKTPPAARQGHASERSSTRAAGARAARGKLR